MAAPTNTADVKKSLANLEPSTHGSSRHSRLVRETAAIGEQKTSIRSNAEWPGSV